MRAIRRALDAAFGPLLIAFSVALYACVASIPMIGLVAVIRQW